MLHENCTAIGFVATLTYHSSHVLHIPSSLSEHFSLALINLFTKYRHRTTEQNDLSSCCEASGVLCGPATHCFAYVAHFPRRPLRVGFLLGRNLRPWRRRRYIPPYTSVGIYRATRPYIPEHIYRHSHCRENYKSNVHLLMKMCYYVYRFHIEFMKISTDRLLLKQQ